MSFQWVEPSDTATGARIRMPIRCVTDVAVQIKRSRIASRIGRRRPIDPINGIGDHLAGVSHGFGAAELDADATARQYRSRQRIIGNLVEPSRAAFAVRAE